MPIARSLAACLTAVLLAGCGVTKYEPVAFDSMKPLIPDAPGCLEKPLVRGAQCMTLVRADQWWSDTGIVVQKGEAYLVTVPPGQAWFDKDRVNTPPRGEHGSDFMNFFKETKRCQERPWFSLIGGVVRPGSPHTEAPLQSADLGSAANEKGSAVFRAREDGALVLYPNDAIGPDTHSTLYYENNSGQIWVVVRWLTGAHGLTEAMDCPTETKDLRRVLKARAVPPTPPTSPR